MDPRSMDRHENPTEGPEEAGRDYYMAAVDRAFELQKSGMKLSRTFFQSWVETLEEGAEINRRTLESLQTIAADQREVFYGLSRESLSAYDGFLDSLSLYEKEVSAGGGPDGEPDAGP